MANAGYGNHTTSDPKTAETPPPETDRASAAPASGDAAQGTVGHSRRPSPGDDVDERHVSTPGAGSLPSDGAGEDVDPGAG